MSKNVLIDICMCRVQFSILLHCQFMTIMEWGSDDLFLNLDWDPVYLSELFSEEFDYICLTCGVPNLCLMENCWNLVIIMRNILLC